MSEMVCIMTFSNRLEADLAKIFLESHGIDAMIVADDCGGFRPDLGVTTGGVKLHVHEEKAEEALGLLQKEDQK